ncbi:MAG: rhodanese-like domain-containing protein [Anaerolineales bacterium]
MNLLEMIFGKPSAVISATELNEKLKNGKKPFVIDVRQPNEYNQGHINGAKLIPLGELPSRLNELPKDKEIICICQSGNRSGSATKILLSAGYNAVNMKGAM